MATDIAVAGEPAGAAKSTVKRDTLRDIEKTVQARWEAGHVFEEDAPADGEVQEKYMATFPYPYMNGRLHLGHSFTISKVEFAVGFQRMLGKRCLFPFGFHCTGMPIKACADKLEREMQLYGCPPNFPPEQAATEASDADSEVDSDAPSPAAATAVAAAAPKDATVKTFKKKGKVAAKDTKQVYQWRIMQSMGVPDEEIPKFAKSEHWLTYFPPLAMEDMKLLGTRVDWRRSFITTDLNPFYDSFIRWQFNKLHTSGKIKFGKRHTIYSRKDGQACADHDRSSGEGVNPQEYTLIKMQVQEPYTGKLAPFTGRKIFLVAATLRPETMYGQTNCWVGPEIEYGVFEVAGPAAGEKTGETALFVCTARAAANMAYQEFTTVEGNATALATVTGADLLGLPLHAPLSVYKTVYCLPMMTVSASKGTGVVTSVPSDSPDDFAALRDLKQKPTMREKYGLKDEWVLPFEVVPIINIEEFGDTPAVFVCDLLKIKSQNDRDALAKAKEMVYLKGFYEGKLIIGEFAGQYVSSTDKQGSGKVNQAKTQIRQQMVEKGEAVAYSEPESEVMSRSGDSCIVALMDQWYLDYGEPTWREQAKKFVASWAQCLDAMEIPAPETRNHFEQTLDWLRAWACSRLFGLGSRLPWDTRWLIESLSDSTIYMAYYTVAHILQGGTLDGRGGNAAGIQPEQMTDAVWDYILSGTPVPSDATPVGIDQSWLDRMRKEFTYWYPLDLRVSGKDLVPNHLTFFIYNHVALFPEDKWPRGVRANGHLLLNNQKMSKSSGNFRTLQDAIRDFGADATRMGLADAGDSVEDANFVEDFTNKCILRLYNFVEWIKETLGKADSPSWRRGAASTFEDRVFENAINHATAATKAAYTNQLYREALKTGFFDMQAARDRYRETGSVDGQSGLNYDLIVRFIEMQALLMLPITPHLSEYIWTDLLHKPTLIMKSRWPEAPDADTSVLASAAYVDDLLHSIRLQKQAIMNPKKPKKGEAPPKPTRLTITVAATFPVWQQSVVRIMSAHYTPATRTFADERTLLEAFKGDEAIKKQMKRVMTFVATIKERVTLRGTDGLTLALTFDERATLEASRTYMLRTLDLQEIEVVASKADDENVQPGEPSCVLH